MIDPRHFSQMIFNPLEVEDKDLVDYCLGTDSLYQMLGGDNGVVNSRHRDVSFRARQIRYILFLYDKNSPLWKLEPDIVNRKQRAAEISGFDMFAQKDTLEQMYHLDDIFLARSISSFIQYQYNHQLAAMIANEQVLFEMQTALRETMTEFKDDKSRIDHYKTKTALLIEQDKILDLINKYKDDVFKGDESALEKTMELGYNRKVTPEQIAMTELKKPDILRV